MTARKMASTLDANSKRIINLPAPTAASTEPARQIDIETVQAYAISRANHTGTQLAATISDFNTAARLNRLDQFAVPTAPVALGAQKITGLADPTVAQDAATKAYVDAQLVSVVSNQHYKNTVRALVKTNVNITSPGSSLDGLTPLAGQVFWLGGQTTSTQNGPYVWNGAATPMTRATNWDTTAEAVVGSYWLITEGTSADAWLILTNDTAVTIGTTVPAYKVIDVAQAQTPAFEQDLGDGTAQSFTLNHNFGTRNVAVTIYRNASPWDDIDVFIGRPSINAVVVEPDEVWSSNQFHAVVRKL